PMCVGSISLSLCASRAVLLFPAPATSDIYTLSLHDALPISRITMNQLSVSERQMIEIAKAVSYNAKVIVLDEPTSSLTDNEIERDRKSTRLNSSHVKISYAVFCLKKKQSESINGVGVA